jgi:hypothetical protein
MGHRILVRAFAALTLLLAAGFAFAPGIGVAQDATPAMAGQPNHPAHIHNGTCDTLGDVVYPLTNLTPGGTMGTPMAGMEGMAASPAAGMEGMEASPEAGMTGTPAAEMGEIESQSTTTVQTTLADLLAQDFAVNVHESAENIGNYIACGNIEGTPENNQLRIHLDELNDSGLQGWAVLMDNGDGTTTVDVVLTEEEYAMGQEAATPTP